ncbi:hypothetical protein RHODGE_RHODGE_03293 [Rhodoplanes serenus]|uniref:Uncharacterized protein n=1 Tax=Rhodoplanes serenus TaxID=200615 RepID=A0A3S4B2J7_9BRAD|nr:hypothetical protein [Rhodoplanes serenus]VCU10107.1 hypothetical protein RHODGE_RHODGE_03293 [Rhodoplanes serenus]
MFTSTCTLVERAVHLGARRPTIVILLDRERWANWQSAALQLVTAWDADAAERAELIDACDRFAVPPSGPTSRIVDALDTIGGLALVAVPAIALCVL